MIRSYEFYEKHSIKRDELLCIEETIKQFESGKVNGKALRRLGLNGLIYCVAEGKIDTLCKLISPIGIEKEDGTAEYKYYMDAISLGFVEYIKGLPSSIMERYADLMRQELEINPTMFDLDHDKLPSKEELAEREALHSLMLKKAATDVVILTKTDKEKIEKALYDLNMGIIGKIKIKDVHARQISGMAHPIRDRRGVAYYSEISNYLPCLALFNMNIATTSNDTEGCVDDLPTDECKCEISIHYDSLSEENKCVADALIANGNAYLFNSFKDDGQDLMISVPCKPEETILEVNKRFMKLLANFTKQDVLHGIMDPSDIYIVMRRWSIFVEEKSQAKVSELLNGTVDNAKLAEALKYFKGLLPYVYDSNEDKFYSDAEVYAKHQEYLVESSFSSGDGSIAI